MKLKQVHKKIKVYVCGVDYQHELGEASDGVTVFPSLDALQRHSKCVDSGCGVVEMEICLKKWVLDQKFKNTVAPDVAQRLLIEEVEAQIKGLEAFRDRMKKELENN